MTPNKIDINKLFYIFITLHLIIWTLVPTLTNNNLPLDTIEALAWGSNLDWGFNKHPPASAFFVEVFYQIFGSNDWAYYLLSQIFVVISFFAVWKFSEEFFNNKTYSLLSVFLLEGIHYYNFTTPEYNVYISEVPFWALTVYYAWKSYKENNVISLKLLGIFSAIGFLSHYLFIYLLIGIKTFFLYSMARENKFYFKYFIAGTVFILIILPHLIWLHENNYITVTYAMHRTGLEGSSFLNHFIHPVIFLGKQIGILIPFLIMCFFAISKIKIKFNFKDKKLLFLLCINVVPIFLIFLTSMIMGVKIRTMWMTPFYLFFGVLFLYIFQHKITLIKIKYFFSAFLILFIISPVSYLYVSISQTDKRTDYPGKEIAKKIQREWENNFKNKIGLVGGDEWHGGNLFYHLESKPKWDNIFNNQKITKLKNKDDGIVIIGDADILSKICNGLFFRVEKEGICMIGIKK